MITIATGGLLFNYRIGRSYYRNVEYEVTMVADLAFCFTNTLIEQSVFTQSVQYYPSGYTWIELLISF